MRNLIEQAIDTHEASELLRKTIHMVKRYGKRDEEGNVNLKMTYSAFALAFGHIDGLRDAIDTIEAAYSRIGYFLMPDSIMISLNLR